MNQLAFDLAPREAGRQAAGACLDAAERRGLDAEGAKRFIVARVLEAGPTSGEDLVDAAIGAGFRCKDARAFGGIFQSLIAAGLLTVLRSDLPRKRGHGTSGGRLYGVVQ